MLTRKIVSSNRKRPLGRADLPESEKRICTEVIDVESYTSNLEAKRLSQSWVEFLKKRQGPVAWRCEQWQLLIKNITGGKSPEIFETLIVELKKNMSAMSDFEKSCYPDEHRYLAVLGMKYYEATQDLNGKDFALSCLWSDREKYEFWIGVGDLIWDAKKPNIFKKMIEDLNKEVGLLVDGRDKNYPKEFASFMRVGISYFNRTADRVGLELACKMRDIVNRLDLEEKSSVEGYVGLPDPIMRLIGEVQCVELRNELWAEKDKGTAVLSESVEGMEAELSVSRENVMKKNAEGVEYKKEESQ